MKKGRNIRERICAVILAVLMPLTSVLPGMTITVHAAEEEHTVSFYVYEEYVPDGQPGDTKELPLSGAEVMLTVDGNQATGTTDAKGEVDIKVKYDASLVKEGTYTVKKQGFKDVQKSITLPENNSINPTEQKMDMSEIQVSANSVTLEYVAGKTNSQKLTISNKVDNTAAAEPGYTWKSAKEQVAAVSSDGTITAKGKGETQITVSRFDKTTSILVTVNTKLSGLTLTVTPADTTFIPGETEVKFSLNNMPADATKTIPVYQGEEQSNPVVILTKDENWTATVSDLNLIGNVEFTAKYPGGENYYLATDVKTATLNYKQLKTLKLTSDSATVEYGSAGNTGSIPVDNTTVVGRTLKYESSAPEVVSVDQNGTYTIHKKGTATITVTAEENTEYTASSANYTLTVQPKAVMIKDSDVKWDKAEKVYDGEDTVDLTGRINSTPSNDIVFGDDELIIHATVRLAEADVGEYNSAAITSVTAEKNENYTITLDNTLSQNNSLNGLDIKITSREVYLKAQLKSDVNEANIQYGDTSTDAIAALAEDSFEVVLAGTDGRIDPAADQGVLQTDIDSIKEMLSGNAPCAAVKAEYDSGKAYYVGQYTIVKVQITTEKWGNYSLQFDDDPAYKGTINVVQEYTTDDEIWNSIDVEKKADDQLQPLYTDGTALWAMEGDNLSFAMKSGEKYDTVNVSQDESDTYNSIYKVPEGSENIWALDNAIYLSSSKSGDKRTRTTSSDAEINKDNVIPDGKLRIDAAIPTVEFKQIGGSADPVVETYVFGGFTAFTKEAHIEHISIEDKGSGLNSASYYLLKFDGADANIDVAGKIKDAVKNDTGWEEMSLVNGAGDVGVPEAEKGFYVVLVKATDNVGNTAVYSSNGLVFEISRPQAVLNITTDSKNGFHNTDVDYTIEVTDPHEQEVYSGISEITVKVTDGDKEVAGSKEDRVNTYTLSNKDLNEIKKQNGDKTSYSLSELLEKTSYEFSGKVLADACTTNTVKIEVTAKDQAGNVSDTVENVLKFDQKPQIPENAVTYDVTDDDECYQSRTMTVKYQYGNFDETQAGFEISENGDDPYTLTLQEILDGKSEDIYAVLAGDTEGEGWENPYHTEDRTVVYNVIFRPTAGKDITYSVIPYIADKEGSRTDYAKQTFTIDNLAPVITVSYDENEPANEKYFNKVRTMTLTYTERNFDELLMSFDVTVNGTAGTVSLAELRTLAEDGENAIAVGELQSDKDIHKLTISFGAQDKDIDYRIVPHITDQADNENADVSYGESAAPEEFTVDMVAPVLEVSYRTANAADDADKLDMDITADIGTDVQDSMYQNTDVAATITITERNFAARTSFSEDEMRIEETAAYVDGTEIKDEELAANTAERAANAAAVQNWIASGDKADQWAQTFDFTDDANYTFNVTYTDMAGNRVTLDKSGEPHRFTSDETLPTADIVIENSVFDKLKAIISFLFFGNQERDIYTHVSDTVSPVKGAYYMHAPGREARGEFQALTEEQLKSLSADQWFTFTDAQNEADGYDSNFNLDASEYKYTVENNMQIVPYEKIEDKAGNIIYINSDGVICEDKEADIDIEILTPAPETEAFDVAEDDIVYSSDVDFRITVDDADEADEVYSGIREISYEIVNNGIVTQSGDYNENFTDEGRTEEFSAEETINSEQNNSNNVEIRVTVADTAGNVSTASRALKIDITDPTLTVNYDNNEVSNGSYFKADRTMTIVYKERNINPEGLTFDFRAGDDELSELTIAELQDAAEQLGLVISDGIDTQANTPVTARTDDRTLTYEITFTGGEGQDLDYEIVPHIEDQSGRTAEADYGEGTKAPEAFTVDKTAPEMSVEYYVVDTDGTEKINVSTDEINRLYKNQTIRAVVKITERNFSPEGEEFSDEFEQVVPHFSWTSYNGSTGSVTAFEEAAVTRENWITESEKPYVRVQSFDFIADGDYSFSMEYTDLAGNELKTAYDTYYFTVDKTAPKISVVYRADGQIITPGEIEADRLFLNKTITAEVTITERNFYRADNAAQFENGQMDLKYTAVDAYGAGVGNSDREDAENPIENYTETANTRAQWKTATGDQQYMWTHTFTFTKDANYTLSIDYTDLAGNSAVDAADSSVNGHPDHCFTVDKTKPTGSIQIRDTIWNELKRVVTFGFFTNTSERVTFTSADKTSDVLTTQYYKYIPSVESRGEFDALTETQLDRITEWTDAAPLTLRSEQQVIVYEKIVDRAGNVTYINSHEGVVVDKTDAAPEITITIAEPAHDIYKSNVPFQIRVTDPVSGGTYAGLREVSYEVLKDGTVTQSGNYNTELSDHTKRTQTIVKNETVYAERNNSNDVEIRVRAVDWAGNESEITKELMIDITDPTIEVTYDLNTPLNERYYNHTRTATVTVTERNFDPSAVRFDITNTDGTQPAISGWSHSANSGISDSATHTCTVTFSADGDYTLTLNATDLAGNDSSYARVDEFTIDQTVPVIQVSYDNNNDETAGYFNENRTATVTVTEHNFNAAEVNAMITARLQGSGVSAPGLGGWSTRGDVHTASVTFSEDADYTFDIEYTDLAGNPAEEYTEDSFTIDKTAPEVEFFDIEDKSANKGTVAPGVRYSDVNYTEAGVDITIEGAEPEHSVRAIDGERSSIANGESIKMADFAHTEDNDDVYTMRAVIRDKAGNETEESVIFSVNRFGSTYEFSPETKAFLDAFYTNDPQDIVVTERNVDTLVFKGISYGRDGKQVELKEGQDYTVKASGSEVSWKEYVYDISSDNFQEEGRYNVTIDSEDRAENMMNNKVKGLDIEFVVDKTAPTVVVTGIEKNHYTADSRDMTINVADNTAVESVQVLINGEIVEQYDQAQIERVNGELNYTIGNSNADQNIRVVAVDLAGNEGSSEEQAVLVTSNLLIQYINNTPLLIGSIAAVIIIAGGLIWFLLIPRKRKTNKENNA